MGQPNARIRQPAWAGQFYPSSPLELQKKIRTFLASSPVLPCPDEIVALIAPHAGYDYSGQTAAAAYKQVANRDYETVVLISPSHADAISGVAIYSGDYYATPLGLVPINQSLSGVLAERSPALHLTERGHQAGGERAEHALEVHLPFLQTVLPQGFLLVAVVFHDYSWKNCVALGDAIAESIDPQNTLIVASSDLYHGSSYADCLRTDARTLQSIAAFDVEQFWEKSHTHEFQACGAGPITSAMLASRRLGADQIQIIAKTNSADVAGYRSGYVVGYGAAMITRLSTAAKQQRGK